MSSWSNLTENPIVRRVELGYEVSSMKKSNQVIVLKGTPYNVYDDNDEKLRMAQSVASHADIEKFVKFSKSYDTVFKETLPEFTMGEGQHALKKYVSLVIQTTRLYPEFKSMSNIAFHGVLTQKNK